MEVMIVNGNRYLINTDCDEHVVDANAQRILDAYPPDAIVDFDEVGVDDVTPKTVEDLLYESKQN